MLSFHNLCSLFHCFCVKTYIMWKRPRVINDVKFSDDRYHTKIGFTVQSLQGHSIDTHGIQYFVI